MTKTPRQDTHQSRAIAPTAAPASEAGAAGQAEATTTVESAAAPEAPVYPTSAAGLPVDDFHGKGGRYVIRDGVRTRKP